MPWGVLKDQTIPALKDASLEERKAFAKVANAALNEGKSEKDAIIAGLSSAKNAKAVHKAKLPQHLQAILDIVDSARNAPEIEPQDTPQNAPERSVSSSSWFSSTIHTLDDSNAAESVLKASEGTARNLIGANFDTKGALILKFSNGDTIRTNEQVLKEYIEQYVTVATTPFFDWIKFNTEANVPNEDFLPGMLRWNAFDGTLDLRMGNNATLQVGMEMYCPPVLNNTGVAIPEGSAVYATGGDAGTSRITFGLATADPSFDSFRVLGITTEEVPNGAVGFITSYGLVRTLNTTGIPYGETWNAGDILYVSPSVAGRLTNIKPISPYESIPIAFVGIVNAVNGTIFVKPSPVSRLDYGSFYDTTDQVQIATETPSAVRVNTTKEAYGITVANQTRVTTSRAGLYEFQFNLQVSKSNSNAQNMWVWARVNGVDVPASANKLSVQGSGTLLVPSWSFQEAMNANDYFELMWAVDSTTIALVAPASTLFCPSTPSATLTVAQVNIS